jgi:hypothetical protein
MVKVDFYCNQVSKTKEGYSISLSILDSAKADSTEARIQRAGNRNIDLFTKSKEFADSFEPGEEYVADFNKKK